MGQCTGICSHKISLEEYNELADKLIEVIGGKAEEIKKEILEKMRDSASMQNYESAARYRDILAGLEEFQTKQSVLLLKKDNQDYIALGIWGEVSAIFVLRRRDGKIVDGDFYYLSHPKETGTGEQIEAFIENYYAFNRTIPPLVYISHQIISPDLITLWLSDRAGRKVKLLNKCQGENNRLMKLAMENAVRKAEERFLKIHGLSRKINPGVVELGKILEMEELPLLIEAYDISNLSGREAVGSRVVFQDGKPAKNLYRQFKIQCEPDSGDYAMIREVLERRFKDSKKLMGPEPDLILIDGGKGHFHVAREVIPKTIPVISLAKREEEIFTEFSEKSIRIPFDSPASRLVRCIRDEAHRFAITAHRKKRSKKVLDSELENISGIGSARRKILLKSLGSVKKIKEASVKELMEKGKVPESVAKNIYKFYHE
jgi:excinuclease ABC subunit C